MTRNAVIGKVHRLGLSGRAAPSQPATAGVQGAARRARRPAAAPVRERAEPIAAAPTPIYVREETSVRPRVLTLAPTCASGRSAIPRRTASRSAAGAPARTALTASSTAGWAYQPSAQKKSTGGKRNDASELARRSAATSKAAGASASARGVSREGNMGKAGREARGRPFSFAPAWRGGPEARRRRAASAWVKPRELRVEARDTAAAIEQGLVAARPRRMGARGRYPGSTSHLPCRRWSGCG